jgi:hypothetical protein
VCLCERSRGGLALSLRKSLRLLHLLGFFFLGGGYLLLGGVVGVNSEGGMLLRCSMAFSVRVSHFLRSTVSNISTF